MDEAIDEAPARCSRGRVVWHVNSTARGGGVAELLHSLLAYARGAGVDVRWLTIDGNPDFFRVTKRIHNHLHGSAGDGGPLGSRRSARSTSGAGRGRRRARRARRAGDVVYIHDPQPAGLVPHVTSADVEVIWRCHIGVDRPGELHPSAWDFLRPYVEDADAYVFSRDALRLGGPRPRPGLDRPTLDRRLLPEEPGARSRRGRVDPRRDRPRRPARRQPRSLRAASTAARRASTAAPTWSRTGRSPTARR